MINRNIFLVAHWSPWGQMVKEMRTWHNIEVVRDYVAALFVEKIELLVRCDYSI